MLTQTEMMQRLSAVFEPRQAKVLTDVITEAYSDLVRARDFNELKEIVRELAEAQKRTELRVEELAEAQQAFARAREETQQQIRALAQAQEETRQQIQALAQAQEETRQQIRTLAQAQEETQRQVRTLAQAQEETQRQVRTLAQAQEETQQQIRTLALAQEETTRQIQELVRQMGQLRREVGGLGRSMGYALENEAYRMLPDFLARNYGIQVTERFIRTYVDGEEINLFGRGRQNGREVLLVGEVKVRLEEERMEEDFGQLERKAHTVREAYPDEDILLLLITHHAHPLVLRTARERGILVVQSFEW